MNLGTVKSALEILNPLDGTNPDGNCTVCAVLSAEALVEGAAPLGPAPKDAVGISEEAGRRGKQELFQISPDHMRSAAEDTRAHMVWKWLQHEARLGVYLFEQDEDHVYNFVKDGSIYLIDSATQIYRKVNTPGDCSVVSPPYQPGFKTMKVQGVRSNTGYGFNYLSPQPLEDEDDLHVYWWGQLHVTWR
jgi:hypothetical protein